MLLNYKELPEETQKVYFLHGLDYVVAFTYQDSLDYKLYQESKLEEVTESKELEMKTLGILEKLGFPMDEAGTYLYKNMILKVVEEMENGVNSNDLLLQMKQPYSQFYLDVARNDLDIGIKTFHGYINKALEKVDITKQDENLFVKIFGDVEENIDYGEQAFILGNYVTCKYESTKNNKPAIKKLSGLPKIVLKENI